MGRLGLTSRPARLLWSMLWVTLTSAALAAAPSTQPHVEYRIIVTGGELLSGAYADAHTHFLTRTLTPLGLRCVGSMSVDDKSLDIQEAIRFSKSKAPLVIVTGGLGPTDNDVTRESLCRATGIELREDPDVLRDMLKRFNVTLDQLRPNLRRQARVPARGTYLANPNGTAIGLVFDRADSVVVALPGPPRELQPMVRDQLVPYLNQRFGSHLPGYSLTVRFVGLGQSQISQTLKEHVPLAPEITLSSQFDGSRVDFTFALPDDTPRAREQLNELKQHIHKQLGEYIYADDETSLEEHVATLLAARGTSLTLVEVGSGGSLAAAFSESERARSVLAGAYVAASEEKLRHMLHIPADSKNGAASSIEKAQAVLAALAKPLTQGWVIVVGEVQQDPTAGRSVEVIFRLPDGHLESHRFAFRGSGELARTDVATQIWDHLRRRLR